MSKTVFFVDDDKMILNLLEYTFQSRQQYKVISFESGEDCIAALDMDPDLIVLDHQLSSGGEDKMDGIQTLEKIRVTHPDMPVVVLTGQGTEDLYNKFKSKGVAAYLTKDDFFVDHLFETIKEVLG